MAWYALFTETGKEEVIQNWLELYFDKSILYSIIPKKKIEEKRDKISVCVIKKLLPGYVLINTKMSNDIYYKIKSIPQYAKILGDDYYTEIPLKEIEPILKLIDDSGVLKCSKIYTEDSKVIVIDGPLKGKEAIIKKVNKRKKRAKILLDFAGCTRFIDVGIEVIETTKKINN